MDSVRDYSSIIHSPSFTFLVGPRHTKLTIQSALAQHVSKPLHNLMNGHTRESKHRIAVLEEEDVETFVAFCEYAYTGDYSVPRTESEEEALEDSRSGVVENAPSPGTSWRDTYRSESVSSAVPPPAPSPPPGDRSQAETTVYQEPEPPAEPPAGPEPEPESAVPEPEPEYAAPEPEPEYIYPEEAVPETEPEHTEVNGFEYADSVVPDAPEQPDYPAVEPQAYAEPEYEAPVKYQSPARKLKKSKKAKKANKIAVAAEDVAPATEEPVNLTPPSTPPPAAAPEEWLTAEGELEPEPPTEEPTPEPAQEPEPELEPEQTGDWGQPPAETAWTPKTSEPLADSWFGEKSQMPRPRPMLDMSFAQQQASSPCEPGLSMWDEFVSLQYNDDAASNISPVESTSNLPYLTFHAKVYVFATRYLIPALAQLCLRKLHRDLLLISFTEQETAERSPSQKLGVLAARKAQMVLNLVHYTYTKTARLEPISPTSATQLRENELRRLVVHYAACKVKDLAKYHSPDDSATATPSLRPVDATVERAETSAPKSLRSLLDMTTELASDLVYRMM
ncbi:uncharacterized protein N7511_003985 [Penicillium nucicola]|uniref:uncharacterized protein n=1 Tax=Penicillium nucicola TaxID=1850975 RepID=UPI002544EE8B|nr:uncharacterized protein N7511_003985 [Penicillium nucicola]KAJ5766369.1 hypothetical protein N7511_003985 [Penicillium nucicola]